MESYNDIITRLADHLSDIEKNASAPLLESANKYRQTCETVCKAVIVGHGEEYNGNLDALIHQTASILLKKEENSRDVDMFKTEARYIQNIGNTFSHDGVASGFVKKQDQSKTFDSLVQIIRICFFGGSELDPPILPEDMAKQFPTRLIGRSKYENPRSEETVRLCFPKSQVKTVITRSDHVTRLVYDYVVANLGSGISKGMVFLRSRTALEKSLLDLHEKIRGSKPSSLQIITPRVFGQSGREIDRLKSISDILKSTPLGDKSWNVDIQYFDDFVWEFCLPESLRTNEEPPKKLDHFIQQSLSLVCGTESPITANNHIDDVLTNPREYNPVQIITGPAGIGKTTFCDNVSGYISENKSKRVVLLSATDFRDISNTTSIESVSDLYRVANTHGIIDESISIENHNFEINIACGNFVLIIDGFDELESHLGDTLIFDKFMRSLADLEECFRKVLVIMTVRDYDIDRFRQHPLVSIYRLLGFSDSDTNRYLNERLNRDQAVADAKRLLRSFQEGRNEANLTTVPLYASLICDHLIEEESEKCSESISASDSSKFFLGNSPLDTLIRKIVDREIAKQSLGKISPDDFFEILIEIIRAPQLTITKHELLDCIKGCEGGNVGIKSTNFLRNPFLQWSGENISFKYDSLTYFFKSRYLARRILDGLFSPSPSVDFMGEFCRGEGPLYNEMLSVLPPSAHAETQNTLNWAKDLIKHGLQRDEKEIAWRKALSGFLYWTIRECSDKIDRTSRINKYFDGTVWDGFSIFGRFYPLDLTEVSIKKAHIENYSQIHLCDFDQHKPVFLSGNVSFDKTSLPDRLDRSTFSQDCILSPNLQSSFEAKQRAEDSSRDAIRHNLNKILKVGFKANRFYWKSSDVYKSVTVIGKSSREHYLDLLAQKNILNLEPNKSDSHAGYIVSDEWQIDARKLIEENNLTSKMKKLISDLLAAQ